MSAAVRRGVWTGDAGRWPYTDDRGRRCAETLALELHHREAHAFGGPDTVANLERAWIVPGAVVSRAGPEHE